jgi:hypothetical protein
MSRRRKNTSLPTKITQSNISPSVTQNTQKSSLEGDITSISTIEDVTQEVPILTKSKFGNGMTFTQISHLLPLSIFPKVISHAIHEIDNYLDEIKKISEQINIGINLQDAENIVKYIESLIRLKELILKFVSWGSVISNIVNYFIEEHHSTLSEELDDFLPNLCGYLETTNDGCDTFLTFCPKEPVLGISLAPDQKQISETKAMIAKLLFRLKEVQTDNEIAGKDSGFAEQNAYTRMMENSHQNVPAEVFLDWLSELEQGKDV